jgi:hypothetical protein
MNIIPEEFQLQTLNQDTYLVDGELKKGKRSNSAFFRRFHQLGI